MPSSVTIIKFLIDQLTTFDKPNHAKEEETKKSHAEEQKCVKAILSPFFLHDSFFFLGLKEKEKVDFPLSFF